MDSVPHILISLYQLGVHLCIEDGQLRYNAPQGILSLENIDRLRARKSEIIDFLAKSQSLSDVEKFLPSCVPADWGSPACRSEGTSLDASSVSTPYWKLMSISKPWEVRQVEFDVRNRKLEFRLGWNTSGVLLCPECGSESALHDHEPERCWRHPSTRLSIVVRASVPRYHCSVHGVRSVNTPWLFADASVVRRNDVEQKSMFDGVQDKLRVQLKLPKALARYATVTRTLRPIADTIRRPTIVRSLKRLNFGSSDVFLPFDIDPPYRTYQCFGAHPLSILGGVADLAPLLASYYINLSCLKMPIDGFVFSEVVPRRAIGHFILAGHCELISIRDRTIFEVSASRRLIQLLIDSIREGCYILLHINKYYVPAHDAYLMEDCLHDCLVTGFDVGRQTFRGVMYLKTGEYGVTDISFANMALALISRGNRYFLEDSACYTPIAILVRPRKGLAFRFDWNAARKNLGEYLWSWSPDDTLYVRDDLEYAGDWAMAMAYPAESKSYGLRAFCAIVCHLKLLMSAGQRVDLRDTRALWEHKKIMHSNLKFWNEQLSSSSIEPSIQLYGEVVHWVRDLHFMCFAHNEDQYACHEMTRGKVSEHFNRFLSIVEIEREILTRMLRALDDCKLGAS